MSSLLIGLVTCSCGPFLPAQHIAVSNVFKKPASHATITILVIFRSNKTSLCARFGVKNDKNHLFYTKKRPNSCICQKNVLSLHHEWIARIFATKNFAIIKWLIMNPFKFGTIVENEFFTDRIEELATLKMHLDSENHIILIIFDCLNKSFAMRLTVTD